MNIKHVRYLSAPLPIFQFSDVKIGAKKTNKCIIYIRFEAKEDYK